MSGVDWNSCCRQASAMAGNVRLILCLLQAVQELQALGRGRLDGLGVGVGFGLRAHNRLLAIFLSQIDAVSRLFPRASPAVSRVCRATRSGRRRSGLVSKPRSRALIEQQPHPASLPSHLCHVQTTADDATTTIGGCTYRYFLPLRWTAVIVAHSSAGSLALGRALHFARFRDRVVYPSVSQGSSAPTDVVGWVQGDARCGLDPWTRLCPPRVDSQKGAKTARTRRPVWLQSRSGKQASVNPPSPGHARYSK